MSLSGFHFTENRSHVGLGVPDSLVEVASPMPERQRNAWKYHESIPDEARIDRYFYGYDDLETLTEGWDKRKVLRLQRVSGWRSRQDATTKRREYYLFDLLTTDWSYMIEWPGQRIDPELLQDSYDYFAAKKVADVSDDR